MKYKVGDKVLVRTDLEVGRSYGEVGFVTPMEKYRGRVMTISSVTSVGDYHLEEAWEWVFSDKMFVAPEDMTEAQRALMDAVEKETVQNPDAPRNNPVSHPSHYTDGRIEVIDFIQDKKLNFCRGNIVKYVARAGKKGDRAKELEDLRKARQYCDFEIKALEGRI